VGKGNKLKPFDVPKASHYKFDEGHIIIEKGKNPKVFRIERRWLHIDRWCPMYKLFDFAEKRVLYKVNAHIVDRVCKLLNNDTVKILYGNDNVG